MFRRGDKVIEHMLLANQIARLVPFFPVLATAAKIGDDVNATGIKPNSAGGIEGGRQIDAIPAVRVQQRGILPIKLQTIFSQYVQRDLRSVLRYRKFANDFDIAKIRRRRQSKRCPSGFMSGWIKSVPSEWSHITGVGENELVSFPGIQATDRRDRQDGNLVRVR